MLPTPIRFDPSLERSHDDAPSELHLSAAVYRHPTTSLSLGDPEALKAAKTLSPGKALHPHGPADQFFGSEAQVPGARTSARGPGWKRRRLTKKNNQEGSEFRGSLKKTNPSEAQQTRFAGWDHQELPSSEGGLGGKSTQVRSAAGGVGSASEPQLSMAGDPGDLVTSGLVDLSLVGV